MRNFKKKFCLIIPQLSAGASRWYTSTMRWLFIIPKEIFFGLNIYSFQLFRCPMNHFRLTEQKKQNVQENSGPICLCRCAQ